MSIFGGNKIDYESCVAFYEQRLSARRARRVQRWLRDCPEWSERARREAAWRAQVREQYADVFEEPLPRRLVAAAERDGSEWRPWLAAAGAVTLAVALGWQLGNSQPFRTATMPPPDEHAAQQPDRDTQPVAQIFNRLGHPNLSAHGYQLTARQVLRPGPRPLVKYLYTNERGDTVKIYARPRLGALTAGSKTVADNTMSPVRWHRNGVGYMLVNGARALAPHVPMPAKASSATQPVAAASAGQCAGAGDRLQSGCAREAPSKKAAVPAAMSNTHLSMSTQPQPVAR